MEGSSCARMRPSPGGARFPLTMTRGFAPEPWVAPDSRKPASRASVSSRCAASMCRHSQCSRKGSKRNTSVAPAHAHATPHGSHGARSSAAVHTPAADLQSCCSAAGKATRGAAQGCGSARTPATWQAPHADECWPPMRLVRRCWDCSPEPQRACTSRSTSSTSAGSWLAYTHSPPFLPASRVSCFACTPAHARPCGSCDWLACLGAARHLTCPPAASPACMHRRRRRPRTRRVSGVTFLLPARHLLAPAAVGEPVARAPPHRGSGATVRGPAESVASREARPGGIERRLGGRCAGAAVASPPSPCAVASLQLHRCRLPAVSPPPCSLEPHHRALALPVRPCPLPALLPSTSSLTAVGSPNTEMRPEQLLVVYVCA